MTNAVPPSWTRVEYEEDGENGGKRTIEIVSEAQFPALNG